VTLRDLLSRSHSQRLPGASVLGSNEGNKIVVQKHPSAANLCAGNETQGSTTTQLLRVKEKEAGGRFKVEAFHGQSAFSRAR